MTTWEKIFIAPAVLFLIALLASAGKILFDVVWNHGWSAVALIVAAVYATAILFYALIKNGRA